MPLPTLSQPASQPAPAVGPGLRSGRKLPRTEGESLGDPRLRTQDLARRPQEPQVFFGGFSL